MARYRIVKVADELYEVHRKSFIGWFAVTELDDPFHASVKQFKSPAEAKAYLCGPSYEVVEEFNHG